MSSGYQLSDGAYALRNGAYRLGGGVTDRTITAAEADAIATTWSGLTDALAAATAGDVVFADADIRLQGTLDVPADVTLAGDRGIDGAAGPRLWTDVSEFTGVTLAAGARLSGVHLDGPISQWVDYTEGNNYPGVRPTGADATIENCEIEGFHYAGVDDNGQSAFVTHCTIHTMAQLGLGYGVVIQAEESHPIINRCYFNYTRHAIAAADGEGGYTATNCHFGPDALEHVIDHHGPAGSKIIVRNCTIEPTHHTDRDGYSYAGDSTEAIRIREHDGGGQADAITIEDNWFYHPTEPTPPGGAGEAIWIDTPSPGDTWDSVNASVAGNHYGESPPLTDVGAPASDLGAFGKETDGVIDSYESGGLSPWRHDLDRFSVANDGVGASDGAYYLHGQSGGTIYSTSGLPNYFGRGSCARAHVYCEGDTTERAWVLFGADDNLDHYAARVDWVNGAFALVRRVDGTLQTLAEDTGVAPAAGQWLAVEIYWRPDDTITLALVDLIDRTVLARISAGDATHAGNQGVGVTTDGQGTNAIRVDAFHRGVLTESTSDGGGGDGTTTSLGMVTSFEGDVSAFRGQTGAFDTVDTAALGFDARDGTHVLRSTTQGEIYSLPGDGLARYPQKGQRGEVWLRWGDTPTYEARFNLGFADQSNNYLFRVRPSGPELEIGSEHNGDYTVIDSAPIDGALVEGSWFRVEWMWDDGRWETEDRLSARLSTGGGTTMAQCGDVNDDHADQRGIALRNWNGPDGDPLHWDAFEITGGKS